MGDAGVQFERGEGEGDEEQSRGSQWLHHAHKCIENRLDYQLLSSQLVLACWCKSNGRAAVQNLG